MNDMILSQMNRHWVSLFEASIFLTLQLLSPCMAMAQSKYLYVLGGAGDPPGNGTIFDDSLRDIGNFVNHSDWKTSISFDGGHAGTEALVQKNFSNAENLGDFSKSNYKKMIKDLIVKLESGQISSGDQLMILISTHGAEKIGKEIAHEIAAAGSAQELVKLSGTESVSTGNLKKIVDLAREKGVKLGLIDASCFSGNTLELADGHACVMSITGTKQFGYANVQNVFTKPLRINTFEGAFFNSMKPGKNIEEFFFFRHGKIA